MLRAAIAPMLLAEPIAMMHWPAFSADGWAATTMRYLVAAVVVTVMLMSVAAGLEAPEAPGRKLLLCTTKPLADIEVTLPLAPPKPDAPRLPVGRGLGLKLAPGRGEKVPRGKPFPPPPNPPNPPAPVQLPLTGVLMVTVVAVTGPLADPLVEG
jgi:hypothetical protein